MSKYQVKYTGPSQHTRILTDKDFKDQGFTIPGGEAVWEAKNRHTVVLDNPSEDLLEYLKSDDFQVKKIGDDEEPKEGKPEVEAQVADDTQTGDGRESSTGTTSSTGGARGRTAPSTAG